VGEDLSIRDLALLIKKVVGFAGDIRFDPSKPDGTPRKLLDVNGLYGLGWKAGITVGEEIQRIYQWFFGKCSS